MTVAEIKLSHGVEVLDWTPQEIEAWSLPELLPTADWAERYVHIPSKYAAVAGRFRLALTPYLRSFFDAIDDPTIETITMIAGTQTGKSLAMYVAIMSGVAQRPGPRLLVMPAEADAREVAGEVLAEYARGCEPVMALAIDGDRALQREGYAFTTGDVSFGWSNSPASLARRPCREVFYDEADKFPPYVGRETHAINLGDKRLRTFRNTTGCKSVRATSPTTVDGLGWQSFITSDQRKYWVKCPSCGEHQIMVWERVRWPKGADGHSIDPDEIEFGELARYACRHCDAEWSEADKNTAVRFGRWAQAGCRVNRDGMTEGTPDKWGTHAGFHIPALLSPFSTLSQLAASYLRRKDNPVELQDFVNNELGEVWQEVETAVDIANLRSHKSPYRKARMDPATGMVRAEIPPDVQAVTCFVDRQAAGYYVAVRGWGAALESWVLDYRYIVTEDELVQYLTTARFVRPAGSLPAATLKIMLPLIDSGDRAADVYDLCDRSRAIDLRPTKGGSSLDMPPYRTTVRRNDPRSKRRYTGDVVLYVVHPSYWKDLQAMQQNNSEPGPRYMHLPEDVDEDYLQQITSEAKGPDRRRGKSGRSARKPSMTWQLRPGRLANHYWDCEAGNSFAAELMGLRGLQPGGGFGSQKSTTTRKRRVGTLGGN